MEKRTRCPTLLWTLKNTGSCFTEKSGFRVTFLWTWTSFEGSVSKKIVSVFRYCTSMLIKFRACPDEFNDLSVFTFDLHLTDLWVCIQRTHSSDIVSSKCTICSVYKSHHYVLFDLYNVFWPVLPSPVVERGNRFGWWPQDVPIRRPRELAGEIRSISSG